MGKHSLLSWLSSLGMHRALTLTLLFLATAGYAQTPPCRPLPGADVLWSKPNLRFVLVGEMHGTAETPQAFLDLVCAARAARRPLLVGLERPSAEQRSIDAFLAAGDHNHAVDALLGERDWGVFDGRSSKAMLALLENLRLLRLRGDIRGVVAFDDRHLGETPAQRDQRMAAYLTAAADGVPGSLVIVLTGNLHASRQPIARFGGLPWMAMLLPPETISLLVTDKGGEAWDQTTSQGCGPHALEPSGGDQRGVFLSQAGAAARFDGQLSTGSNATASAPALPNAPSPPACTTAPAH
jgi:hypothetical protein